MKKRFSISDMCLGALAGFGIGGLVTLIINTVQTSKVKGKQKPMKLTCNINATLEPEKKPARVKKSEIVELKNKTNKN